MKDISSAETGGGGRNLPAKLTLQVVVCSVIAAVGGLMFGYDIGISGGVTGMDMFLKKFFPSVYVKKHEAKSDNYCKYNNEMLQLFTSSLHLAAMTTSFFASLVCKRYGRRRTMQIASLFFLAGAILNAAAQNVGMLIGGRLCLGTGVGFGNLAVPLFISEIAPPRYRGGLNICFQLMITLGILGANLINYGTSKLEPYGWRISLGGAAVPAVVLLLGSLAIVETPTSLLARENKEEALKSLKKIRGVDTVDEEFAQISHAVELSKQVKHPFKDLFSRSHRPQLISTALLQIFQQFTGVSVVLAYSPILFLTMGLGEKASLLSAVFANTVKPVCTVVSMFLVDRLGRKALLIEGAIQMCIALAGIGVFLGMYLHTTGLMPVLYADVVLGFVCLFLAGFAWSWGPLGWLIPSEIFPVETRSAGFFVAVSTNMLFTFITAQTFLTMLCHLRSRTFYVYSGLLAVMCLYAIYLLPETKGIPIDEMVERVWKKHWFWKRYYKGCEAGKKKQESLQDEPQEHKAREDNYCKYDNQFLQLFTSSLYLAAIVASFAASIFCKKFGRKPTIQAASVFFLVGAILNAFAMNLAMLILGRIFLGAGVGFGNQAVPLFISEIAPSKYRGGLNICFQLLITIGILIANIVNYRTSKVHPYGWRYSLGGAAVPALILLAGSLVIEETPTSLMERGKKDKAKAVLRRIRGVDDVSVEYSEILSAVEVAKQIKHPFRNLMKLSSFPQLFCGTILQVFQQFTGINVVMFYAPVLFQTMGIGSNASLLSAVITDSINVVATLIAIVSVDRLGRRGLLIEGCGQMLIAQTAMGVILGKYLHATNVMPKLYAEVVLVLICVFVSGFAWSWGPLGWLVPSEIFPLETRNAGFFFAVSMNMFCTFLIAQAFLTMLCHLKSYTFYMFSGWIIAMALFAIFLLPETKGVPIDEMNERVWKRHWLWKRFYKGDTDTAAASYVDKRSHEIQDITQDIKTVD
ncbi:hypothetical protein Tsubulata_005759 [Turnera subulata]|uniref:Major facilitator superfamily (MFS) profile domain-containing protein n=1 Tax=Turnera subulata TaxID=218843 RepID=A0A9Q0F8K5_9ROSI|nr:hypothetical protein Tsubulata_005759 [Turnera subulata]